MNDPYMHVFEVVLAFVGVLWIGASITYCGQQIKLGLFAVAHHLKGRDE